MDAGASGSVYRALDVQAPDQPPVALKVLKDTSQVALANFEREARFLSKLQHPGLVPIYGFSKSGDEIEGVDPAPCFWMELVDGASLQDAVRGATPEQILAWLQQSLQALDYLHGQGILHGDIKPANIMVDKNGQARLVDFGFAIFAPKATRAEMTKLKGAIPYLAPELLKGERGTGSDIFSLGTVFYEALAGHHPRRDARNLRDLFSPEFQRLADRSSSIPKRVAKVIDRMIEADALRRFKSVSDVLEALESGETKEVSSETMHSFLLFGREFEWDEALRFIQKQREDKSRGVILIHGLTGTGKNRFTQELFFHLVLEGIKVAQLQAKDVGRLQYSEDTFVTMVRGAENLRRDHLRDLYHFLKSDERADGVLILEYNDDHLDAVLAHFFANLKEDSQVLDIGLHPLARDDAEQFIGALLQQSLPTEIIDVIYERTQGNPELLTQTVKEIRSSGLAAKKHLSLKEFQQISLPENFEDLLKQRVEKLNAAETEIIRLIATTLLPVSRNHLRALYSGKPTEVGGLVNGLIDQGLIKNHNEDTGAYQLAHPRLADIVLNKLDARDRNKIHQHWLDYWGEVFESGNEELEADLIKAMAHHAAHLPLHPKQIEWVLKAGSIYIARHEAELAEALFNKCLQHDLDPSDRELLLRQLANAYGSEGNFVETIRIAEQWHQEFPQDEEGLNPVKYGLSTGVAYKNLGQLSKARQRLEFCLKAGDLAKESHRPRLARAHSMLGLLDINEEKFDSAQKHFIEAHGLLPEETQQKAEIYKHQALMAAEQGDWDQALLYLQLGEGIYELLSSTHGLFSSELEKGNLALQLGRADDVEASYNKALEIAAQSHDESLLARVYQNLGVFATRRGDYLRALEELEKARELFLFFGSPYDQGLNLLQLALVWASVGHFDQADSFSTQADTMSGMANIRDRQQEVRFEIDMLRHGKHTGALAIPRHLQKEAAPVEWDLERRWVRLMLALEPARQAELPTILTTLYERLSDPLKLSFEERPDYQKYCLAQAGETETQLGEIKTMDILQKLHGITKDLLGSNNVDEVLQQIMDAAMQLSGAERGFLLIKAEDPDSPVAGYSVKVARNISKDLLEGDDFRVSLSAVGEVVKNGQPLVTDNAILDQRFESAESVHELDLKSILVLPLTTADEVVGVLYMDHSYETERFHGQESEVLQIFADHAGLALQKAQMIQGLRQNNKQLAETVDSQSSELTILKKDIAETRQKLTYEYGEIVGQSPAMLEVLSLVDRLVDTSIPVWIFGESGTGKEMIASALHYKGPRAKKAFVSENCSSLPETLLESELFGHKKGAFTHADRDKKGLLEYANGGTVFLDEIADMSPPMQAKLLRFLQEGEIRPLGSNQVITVDVRVVSASNKDLNELIVDGSFREDLFYRLNGMTVTLPPLRERIEDIPILVKHFLEKMGRNEKRDAYEITPEALELLTLYTWPGNVRELENTVRSASLFHHKKKLLPKSFHFKKALFEGRPQAMAGSAPAIDSGSKKLSEKNIILKALQDSGFNKKLAAEALGISRRYLYTQLQKHNIPIKRVAMKAFIESQTG